MSFFQKQILRVPSSTVLEGFLFLGYQRIDEKKIIDIVWCVEWPIREMRKH
jgi:hypothetical protein